ncbi:MAG: DJ-1/PfpI family protein [Planctomycetota bacterium]
MRVTIISLATCLWCIASISVASEPATAKETPSSKEETPARDLKPTTRTLGIVLYDRFELLDVAGPAEIFGNVGPRLKLVMIAEKVGPVRSNQGVAIHADHSFNDAPPLDLILVPGGFGTLKAIRDKALLDWLRTRGEDAELVMSVCSGSGILAKAGMLDGKRATTNKQSYRFITPWGPEVEWVKEARWVDDGEIVTSSGVSAGMDMALHVVKRLYGEELAQRIADLTEYEWHRDANRDPFAKFAK